MAWTLYGFTHISKRERKELNDTEMKMVQYHEASHRRQGFYRNRIRAELIALKDSINDMMHREDLSFEECIRMEIDYQLWLKYGYRLHQLMEELRKGLKKGN